MNFLIFRPQYPLIQCLGAIILSSLGFSSFAADRPESRTFETQNNQSGISTTRRSTQDGFDNCQYNVEHDHYHCSDASDNNRYQDQRREPNRVIYRDEYRHINTRPNDNRISDGIAIGLGIGLPLLIHNNYRRWGHYNRQHHGYNRHYNYRRNDYRSHNYGRYNNRHHNGQRHYNQRRNNRHHNSHHQHTRYCGH